MRKLPVVVLVLVLAGAAAALAVARGSRFAPSYEGTPPNVLFLSIDTLRADHLGIYGHEYDTSPNIDAWAENAMVFDDCQGSTSWTLPGLASIMTSYYTSTHQCWKHFNRLDPSFRTLAEILRDAGFETMLVTSHIFVARGFGLQQGFIHVDNDFAQSMDEQRREITSHEVSDRGIRFLEDRAAADDGVPWFLWLHYFDPHSNYMEHPGITENFDVEERGDLARYDGEIFYTDLHLGRVLDALERLGLDESTLVVFFSDHGEEFRDHGGLYHGHTLYQELVRSPLIVRGPQVQPGRTPALVRTVDLMPTVLDHVPPLRSPEGTEGRSLVPLLRGGTLPEAPALAELLSKEPAGYDSLIDGRWKLIVNVFTEDAELYDVQADPREQHDVAGEHPEVVADLREKLESLLAEAEEKAAEYEVSAPVELSATQMENLENLGYIDGE